MTAASTLVAQTPAMLAVSSLMVLAGLRTRRLERKQWRQERRPPWRRRR
jgi:hypothetical protein